MIRHAAAAAVVVLAAIALAPWPSTAGSSHAAEPPARPAPGPDAQLHVLMLGDRGHHQPAERAKELIPTLLARGIKVHYTESMDDLNAQNLAHYDALMVYANTTTISPAQEKAVLDYVAGGGGYVPLHCASYCFHNSPKLIALLGGQFKSHGTGVFRVKLGEANHPVVKGYESFESWDETYVHHRHNETDRVVLEYRENEPWTWVRTQGKGRVFYTAWGHDRRTWTNPGFADLVERGIRWASGQDVAAALAARPTLKPFEYIDQRVPYYPPGGDRSGGGEWNQMPKPLPPEESVKHIVTPAGFEVRLFAGDPDIKKPICMAWDERGRLWVAETQDYPNVIRPEGEGRDRITICEDTDGDGRADKFTVFADKLNIPTSIAFANGGVIVAHAPDVLFLKDTDGDDKADVRRVLFTGWSKGDTHAGPSNLRYGLDNQVWGMVGYAGFNGTVGGESQKFAQAFFRFKSDGSKLEPIRNLNNNCWGVGFSEDGLVFGSTANNNPSNYMPIAARYYAGIEGLRPTVLAMMSDSPRFLPITPKVRQVDAHGAYTSGAGHALYTARTYPKPYWNRAAFVNGPTGKLTGVFYIDRDRADCRSTNPHNLVSSDDEWFAPIMAEVGPDGQVWIIDWYTYIVQHNPTPKGMKTGAGNAYETELRESRYGRVYRVVWKDGTPSKPRDLSKATPAQLVATLTSDNMLWRLHAQRLLVERGQRDVTAALVELVNDKGVDAIGLNVGAIHALWTLHGLGAIDDKDATALTAAYGALRHPSAGVRRNALQVLPPTERSTTEVISSGALNDADAQVRLAALLALADMPTSAAAGASVFGMLAEPRNLNDRWVYEAAAIAGVRHQAGFLGAAESARSKPGVAQAGPNLLPNPSFEDVRDGRPAAWAVRNYSGNASHSLVAGGRTGKHALRISSDTGSDTSWFVDVPVKPNTQYRLSGYVKTQGVKGAMGGLFNVHGVGQTVTGAVTGTSDWKRVAVEFNSGNHQTVSINCLFGGWGQSSGTAWYDDVELVEIAGGLAGIERAVGIVKSNADAASGVAKAHIDKPLDTGGDATKGHVLFMRNEITGCFRCHKVGDEGEGVVGPNLAGLATRKDKAYIVQSLIDPNATIAEGYAGQISPMPPVRLLLGDDDIRDLVAYLSTLK